MNGSAGVPEASAAGDLCRGGVLVGVPPEAQFYPLVLQLEYSCWVLLWKRENGGMRVDFCCQTGWVKVGATTGSWRGDAQDEKGEKKCSVDSEEPSESKGSPRVLLGGCQGQRRDQGQGSQEERARWSRQEAVRRGQDRGTAPRHRSIGWYAKGCLAGMQRLSPIDGARLAGDAPVAQPQLGPSRSRRAARAFRSRRPERTTSGQDCSWAISRNREAVRC